MEPITVRFTPTPSDYKRVVWHLTMRWARRPLIFTIIGVSAIIVVLVALIGYWGGLRNIQATGGLAYSFVIIMGIIALIWFSVGLTIVSLPNLAYESAKRSPNYLFETTYTFTNEKFTIKDAHSELTQDWSNYVELLIFESYYILTFALNKNAGRFIPRHAFDSPEREAALVEFLKSKLKFKG